MLETFHDFREPIVFAASDATLTFTNMIVGLASAGIAPATLVRILLLTSVGNAIADACSWWNSRQSVVKDQRYKETAFALTSYMIASLLISGAYLWLRGSVSPVTASVLTSLVTVLALAKLNGKLVKDGSAAASRNTLVASAIGMICTYSLGQLINAPPLL